MRIRFDARESVPAAVIACSSRAFAAAHISIRTPMAAVFVGTFIGEGYPALRRVVFGFDNTSEPSLA
nr:hypothetical protein CFP56_09722 [Quercus suber]